MVKLPWIFPAAPADFNPGLLDIGPIQGNVNRYGLDEQKIE